MVRRANNFGESFYWLFSCCLGLFVKQLLVAVPATLAIVFLLTNRRALSTFALMGLGVFALMLLGSWLYGGRNFFLDFIEVDRAKPGAAMVVKEIVGFLLGGST